MEPFQIFEDPKFGRIRTVVIEGNFYFVGRDVALALGYTKTDKAIHKHVNKGDVTKLCVTKVSIDSDINIEESDTMTFLLINEKGVHALTSGSPHPDAKLFKEWVISKIIPSVHETKADKLKTELRECTEVLPIAQRLLKLHQGFIRDTEARITKLKRELDHITDKGEVREDSGKSDTTAEIAAELNMDPRQLSSILRGLGILKCKDGECVLADKYQGCGYTKTSSN